MIEPISKIKLDFINLIYQKTFDGSLVWKLSWADLDRNSIYIKKIESYYDLYVKKHIDFDELNTISDEDDYYNLDWLSEPNVDPFLHVSSSELLEMCGGNQEVAEQYTTFLRELYLFTLASEKDHLEPMNSFMAKLRSL